MAKKTPTSTDRDQHSLGIEGEKPRVPEWDPRCYDGGNGPNPYLAEWIAEHATPYDAATDDYRREAFTDVLRPSRRSPVYDMHIYTTKKPHDAVRSYVEHYTEPGDLVLDPFCGAGGTALMALALRRSAVMVDRSPLATFLTKSLVDLPDPSAFAEAYGAMHSRLQAASSSSWDTLCHRCGRPARVVYQVFSMRFECPRCLVGVPKWTDDGSPPRCHACKQPVSDSWNRLGFHLCETRLNCPNGCTPRSVSRSLRSPEQSARDAFEANDLTRVERLSHLQSEHPIPVYRFPERALNQRLHPRGIHTMDQLFAPWNLAPIALAYHLVESAPDRAVRDALRFCVSSALLNSSRAYRHRETGGGPQSGALYVPFVYRDNNFVKILDGKVRNYQRALRDIATMLRDTPLPMPLVLSTSSAADLSMLPDRSVDYVFTDPPYGDKFDYWELNQVNEAWLGFDIDWSPEHMGVNPYQDRPVSVWQEGLQCAFLEIHRVLKPGRWLSLCYHDTSSGTWDIVMRTMQEVGFVIDEADEVVAIDAQQKTFKQQNPGERTADRDLVINFRKPYPGERPVRVRVAFAPGDPPELFEQKVITILHAFLTRYPGSTRDVVWDAVVSRLVRQGDMERHDFDAILRQVAAPNEAGEWYLTVDEAEDIGDSEATKADAAAAALEKAISQHQQGTGSEGMDYSDILEWYVVQYRGDRPSRQLTDWLPDYFFQAPAGGYRNPASDAEREQKRMGRDTGLNRLIRRYLRAPASVEPAPDQASLCDWLRHCYRSGLYEEGCRLVDEGHIRLADLPAETQGDVEDDAAMCRSRLRQRAEIARVEKPAKKTRARKPKPEQQGLGI